MRILCQVMSQLLPHWLISSKSYTIEFVQAAWSSKSFDWLFTKKRVRTSSSGNVILLSDLRFVLQMLFATMCQICKKSEVARAVLPLPRSVKADCRGLWSELSSTLPSFPFTCFFISGNIGHLNVFCISSFYLTPSSAVSAEPAMIVLNMFYLSENISLCLCLISCAAALRKAWRRGRGPRRAFGPRHEALMTQLFLWLFLSQIHCSVAPHSCINPLVVSPAIIILCIQNWEYLHYRENEKHSWAEVIRGDVFPFPFFSLWLLFCPGEFTRSWEALAAHHVYKRKKKRVEVWSCNQSCGSSDGNHLSLLFSVTRLTQTF